MLSRLFIGILLFFSGPVWSQSYKSGYSTDTVSKAELSGKTAAELISEAKTNAANNPLKSIQQTSAALEKSIASGDKRSQYHSYSMLGSLYYNVGNYLAAVQYFQLASSGFAEIKDTKSKAFCDNYLTISRKKLAEIKTSEKISKKSHSKSKVETPGYEKAYKDEKTALPEKIDLLTELSSYYLDKKDTTAAVDYLNKAASATLKASDQIVWTNSSFIGQAYNQTGRFADNIRFQNEIIEEGKKRSASKIVGIASHNLGSTYVEAQNPQKAVPYLMQSISIADQEKNIDQRQLSVKELAKAYEKMGRYDKALEVIKTYLSTFDSLQSVQDKNLEANAALNKEFMKQEARIQKLIISQKQKEADIQRQQNIMWGLAAVLGLFGLLTWLLVRNIRQKQKANMQIKLQSLRAQMNPHFIFNSLNSVNNFISKNDERSANKYLSDFSKLMRTVLKNSDQDFVSLETEIQTLKIYLDLEHFRFGEKFDYTLEAADDIDAEHVQVPPMLIQPYIENAIWHGLRYKEEKGLLEVKFYTENEQLFCTIKDNGIGRKQSAALKTSHQKTYQSTGIKNTKSRIDILNKLHGTKLQISIFDLEENGKAAGTLARISVPHIMQLEEI